MQATDVLRFATLNAAIRLQRHDLGLIAAGRRADLVVFDSLKNYKHTACMLQVSKFPKMENYLNH